MSYFSLLFCCRAAQTDIYYNGLPIGQIINGQFKIHQFKLPDGSLRPLTLQDFAHPCPFNSIQELKDKILETVGKIEIKDGENTEETKE